VYLQTVSLGDLGFTRVMRTDDELRGENLSCSTARRHCL
jgi:hypothetical protein